MINSFKKILLTAISLGIVAMPALAPAVAMAAGSTVTGEIQNSLCSGTNANADTTGSGGTNCDTATANTQVSSLFNRVITFFSLLVGIVSVIMIIIGGFQYIISNGDSGKITTAKNTIIFALVGLIIVAMAQFIVHFVLGKIGGIGSGS